MSETPLDGIRVVDLTRILAGPFATMTLADLGADVIKIERPGRGDETRHWGPPFHDGVATYFLAVNRNKRSVALDLKNPWGQRVLWRLLESADVLVSNFRPGVMSRLGFDYPSVAERCPRIVYALLNGYGHRGPFARRSAFDLIIQAESGLMQLTGEPDGPPTKVGVSMADEVAGMMLVQGILAALLGRHRGGRGQQVEVALHDAVMATFTYHAQALLAAGVVPQRMGNAHPSLVPYRPFAALDGELVVGVASDELWLRFCAAVGLEDLGADSRYTTNADRVEHRQSLEERLATQFAGDRVDHWLARMRGAGIPCGRVRTPDTAIRGPEVATRGLLVPCPGTSYSMIGLPIRLGDEQVQIRLRPPQLGEHTDAVLREIGYDAATIEAIHDGGAT